MLVWVPCVLIGIWATSAIMDGKPVIPPSLTNPNAVLAIMVKKMTNPWLGGFLTAGILAAIMSSLDSQFLCIGSIFTNDIAGHYIAHERLSDRQKVFIGRVFVVCIVAVTYLIAVLWKTTGVFSLAVWCFSGFASLFPLVFASIYWRRASKAGAYACVLVAAAVWLDQLRAVGGECRERALLVLAHQPAVGDHVGRQYRCKTPLDALFRHEWFPPRRALGAKFYSGEEGESMRAELWLSVMAGSSHQGFASSASVGKRQNVMVPRASASG